MGVVVENTENNMKRHFFLDKIYDLYDKIEKKVLAGNKTIRMEILAVCYVIAVFLGYMLLKFNMLSVPAEDAVMIFRYAENLVKTGEIVYNIGGERVDGATDFLFMLMLALFYKFGAAPEITTFYIDMVSHILTAVLIYYTVRKYNFKMKPLPAVFSAIYLLVGPATNLIRFYFGTPLFTLLVTLTWYFANELIRDFDSRKNNVGFSVSALIMSLIRPEGVFLTVFFIFSVYLYRLMDGSGLSEYSSFRKLKVLILGQSSLRFIVFFVIFYIVPGALYFIWHLIYFGYLFPNPFYVRGGIFSITSMFNSFRYILLMSVPFLLPLIFGLRNRSVFNKLIFMVVPLVLFGAIWLVINDEMNIAMRYQYPILPILLMNWPELIHKVNVDWNLKEFFDYPPKQRLLSLILMLSLNIGVIMYVSELNDATGSYTHSRDGRYDVGIELSKYADKGYIMCVTEAGLLPYKSGWFCIDAYGLNDKYIAHNGLTVDYLESYYPHLIMIHALRMDTLNDSCFIGRNAVLWEYLKLHRANYTLAAVFGYPLRDDAHYYFIRNDFEDSAAIIQMLRTIVYYDYATGRPAVNYTYSF